MELVRTKEGPGKLFYSFKSKLPANLISALKLVYRVSLDANFSPEYQTIDEPFGIDSDWRHRDGDLIDDLSEKDFLGKYMDFEAESVSVLGEYNETEILVIVLLNSGLITIELPDAEPEEKKNIVFTFVDNVCNEIAGEE